MLIPKRVFTFDTFERIIWRDHTSSRTMDWTTLEDEYEHFPADCNATVGYVLRETADEITMSLTMGTIAEDPLKQGFFGWFTILKGDIVERRTIRLDAHGIRLQTDPVAPDDPT